MHSAVQTTNWTPAILPYYSLFSLQSPKKINVSFVISQFSLPSLESSEFVVLFSLYALCTLRQTVYEACNERTLTSACGRALPVPCTSPPQSQHLSWSCSSARRYLDNTYSKEITTQHQHLVIMINNSEWSLEGL